MRIPPQHFMESWTQVAILPYYRNNFTTRYGTIDHQHRQSSVHHGFRIYFPTFSVHPFPLLDRMFRLLRVVHPFRYNNIILSYVMSPSISRYNTSISGLLGSCTYQLEGPSIPRILPLFRCDICQHVIVSNFFNHVLIRYLTFPLRGGADISPREVHGIVPWTHSSILTVIRLNLRYASIY